MKFLATNMPLTGQWIYTATVCIRLHAKHRSAHCVMLGRLFSQIVNCISVERKCLLWLLLV